VRPGDTFILQTTQLPPVPPPKRAFQDGTIGNLMAGVLEPSSTT